MKTLIGRTPIIPLSYSEKHKAQPKELLIDYETGNIYVVSADDKSVIFDITSKIYEQLESVSGENIEITIEGIGPVKITEILNELHKEIEGSIQAIETGEEISYIGRENVLDGKTLVAHNKKIQLKGFAEADTHMIPRKSEDGNIEWIYMPKLPDINQDGSDNSVSCPSLPSNDGEITEVFIVEPLNDKLYLNASKRQKSININRNCIVILPRVLDSYSEIHWYVKTNSFAPKLKFSNNVIWSNVADIQPDVDANHIYKFVSFDSGETWLGEIVRYNRTANDEVVYRSYLENSYYDKQTVDQKIDDINGVNAEDYYTKLQSNERFYNKLEVDNKLENIVIDDDSIELSNYYNKIEIDNIVNNIPVVDESNLLTKSEATEKYYDKQTVDQKIDDVKDSIPDNADLTDYITNDELVNNYYDKSHIDNNYYTKDVIETYTKLLDDKHYDKEESEAMISWTVELDNIQEKE